MGEQKARWQPTRPAPSETTNRRTGLTMLEMLTNCRNVAFAATTEHQTGCGHTSLPLDSPELQITLQSLLEDCLQETSCNWKAMPCQKPIRPHRSTPVGNQPDPKLFRIYFPRRNPKKKSPPAILINLARSQLWREWVLNSREQPSFWQGLAT